MGKWKNGSYRFSFREKASDSFYHGWLMPVFILVIGAGAGFVVIYLLVK